MRRGRRRGVAARPSPGAEPLGERALQQADDRLIATVDRAFLRAAARAGAHLLCGPGCAECCHGPFPVTRLDVRRLRLGLRAIGTTDRARAERVVGRAAQTVEALTPGFPGDAETGELTADEPTLDAFFGVHADLPCPALEPESGRCELYDWRPVACRLYGPPTRFGDQKAPPCHLCFTGADEETVESCRMDPDGEGLEASILQRMGIAAADAWDTLIAFALRQGEWPGP